MLYYLSPYGKLFVFLWFCDQCTHDGQLQAWHQLSHHFGVVLYQVKIISDIPDGAIEVRNQSMIVVIIDLPYVISSL